MENIDKELFKTSITKLNSEVDDLSKDDQIDIKKEITIAELKQKAKCLIDFLDKWGV